MNIRNRNSTPGCPPEVGGRSFLIGFEAALAVHLPGSNTGNPDAAVLAAVLDIAVRLGQGLKVIAPLSTGFITFRAGAAVELIFPNGQMAVPAAQPRGRRIQQQEIVVRAGRHSERSGPSAAGDHYRAASPLKGFIRSCGDSPAIVHTGLSAGGQGRGNAIAARPAGGVRRHEFDRIRRGGPQSQFDRPGDLLLCENCPAHDLGIAAQIF